MNKFILPGAIVLLVVAAGAFFLLSSSNNSEDSNSETTESPNRANNENETSTPTSMEYDSSSNNISLAELSLSFNTPTRIQEVSELSLYKQIPNVENCVFVGQDSNNELVIVAYSNGSNCLNTEDFDETGTRSVEGFSIIEHSSARNKTDLLLDIVELSNGSKMGFLYKVEFTNNSRPIIAQILSSIQSE